MRGAGESDQEYVNRLSREADKRIRDRERKAWLAGALYGYERGIGQINDLPTFIAERNPYGPELPGTTP